MGPLRGTKVVELAGIGPGPFCAMLLADLGAEVLAVDRPAPERPAWPALFGRGRRRVAVDLKHPEGPGVVLDLVAAADALVEGFRPGVAERLGIGPDPCLARNPRLVYGRVTGWGQDGPWRLAAGLWTDRRGANLLDGAAPFYAVYETADGRHLAVGALEPRFYAELLERVGLAADDLPDQLDRDGWPLLRERLAARFRTRTRDEWCRLLEGTDACVAPVLSLLEAPTHPHNRSRNTFIAVGGVTQPAPAPRFSRTPCSTPTPGEHDVQALAAWGLAPERIAHLRASGAIS